MVGDDRKGKYFALFFEQPIPVSFPSEVVQYFHSSVRIVFNVPDITAVSPRFRREGAGAWYAVTQDNSRNQLFFIYSVGYRLPDFFIRKQRIEEIESEIGISEGWIPEFLKISVEEIGICLEFVLRRCEPHVIYAAELQFEKHCRWISDDPYNDPVDVRPAFEVGIKGVQNYFLPC